MSSSKALKKLIQMKLTPWIYWEEDSWIDNNRIMTTFIVFFICSAVVLYIINLLGKSEHIFISAVVTVIFYDIVKYLWFNMPYQKKLISIIEKDITNIKDYTTIVGTTNLYELLKEYESEKREYSFISFLKNKGF